MSMEKWEGGLGIFAGTECAKTAAENEALSQTAAIALFRRESQAFLKQTRGLKLKPGSMNAAGRHAWGAVLQALDALERHDGPGL